MGGKRWIRQMLVSAFLVPSVVCGTEFFINFIAIYYHASRAIPFGSMVFRHPQQSFIWTRNDEQMNFVYRSLSLAFASLLFYL